MECRTGVSLAVTAMLVLGAAPRVPAHHTYAMFDATRRASLTGTVAKFDWKNPHAYIWLYVAREGGGHDLYTIENGSPTQLNKEGWSKTILQVNDRVTIDYSPLRDGRHGGHCLQVTLADGRTLRCPGPSVSPSTGTQ